MPKLYRYTFRKAGTYTRRDGTKVSAWSAGASVTGPYRDFPSHPDIEVEKIGEMPTPPKS